MVARRQRVPGAEADQPLDRRPQPLLRDLVGDRAKRGGWRSVARRRGSGGGERRDQEQLLHGPLRWTRRPRFASRPSSRAAPSSKSAGGCGRADSSPASNRKGCPHVPPVADRARRALAKLSGPCPAGGRRPARRGPRLLGRRGSGRQCGGRPCADVRRRSGDAVARPRPRLRPRRRRRRLPRQPGLSRRHAQLDPDPRRHLGRRQPGLQLRLSRPLRRRSGAAQPQISRLLGAAAGGLAGRRLPPAGPWAGRGLARHAAALAPCRAPSRRAKIRPRSKPTGAASPPPRPPSPPAPKRSACAPPSANMAAPTR